VSVLLATQAADAAVLPEDRADVMYHYYDGGGVKATGPAILVRKSVAESAAVSASYYVDNVSAASIDVVTTASPYKERRTERGLGLDYVYHDTLITLSSTSSKEPDYIADSASLDVSQDVFGGMTTVSAGYTRGRDTVGRHDDANFSEPVSHWQYRLGVTQVLTKNWLLSANFEAVSDLGYLGSPYRAARVYGTTVPERDPGTRSSRAAALRVVTFIEPQSSVRVGYRYFWDTWDIRAGTTEVGYSRYFFGRKLLGDGYLRYYSQDRALFYSDNFSTEMTYMSRNRELSTFTSLGLGARVTYTPLRIPAKFEVKLNASYEWLRFKYSDFTDVRTGKPYSFDADVLELFITALF
jgi:Protein of unknown function (DUF3570)